MRIPALIVAAGAVAAVLLAPAAAWADNKVAVSVALSPRSGPAGSPVTAGAVYQAPGGSHGRCEISTVLFTWDRIRVGSAKFAPVTGTVPLCAASLTFVPPAGLDGAGAHVVTARVNNGNSPSAVFTVTSGGPPPPPSTAPATPVPVPSPAGTDATGGVLPPGALPADPSADPSAGTAAGQAGPGQSVGSGALGATSEGSGGSSAGTVAIVIGVGLTLCGALVGVFAFLRLRGQGDDEPDADLADLV